MMRVYVLYVKEREGEDDHDIQWHTNSIPPNKKTYKCGVLQHVATRHLLKWTIKVLKGPPFKEVFFDLDFIPPQTEDVFAALWHVIYTFLEREKGERKKDKKRKREREADSVSCCLGMVQILRLPSLNMWPVLAHEKISKKNNIPVLNAQQLKNYGQDMCWPKWRSSELSSFADQLDWQSPDFKMNAILRATNLEVR